MLTDQSALHLPHTQAAGRGLGPAEPPRGADRRAGQGDGAGAAPAGGCCAVPRCAVHCCVLLCSAVVRVWCIATACRQAGHCLADGILLARRSVQPAAEHSWLVRWLHALLSPACCRASYWTSWTQRLRAPRHACRPRRCASCRLVFCRLACQGLACKHALCTTR